MNTLLRYSLLLICIGSKLAMAANPPINMKTGLWKTRIQVELPNGRMPFSFSSERCLSPQDPVPNANKDGDCSTANIAIKNDTVTWVLQCTKGQGDMTGQGKITYKGNAFTGKMEVKIIEETRSAELLYHFKGEYLGPCPANTP